MKPRLLPFFSVSLSAVLTGPAVLCMLTLAPIAAQAQSVFKCQRADGSVYFSDRACPGGAQQAIKIEAPAAGEPVREMNLRCRHMRESMQWAERDRNDDGSRYRELENEYQRDCLTEEQRQYERRVQAREEAVAKKQRQALEQSQCLELGGAIRAKRDRVPSMTAGEKLDYDRQRANFERRCL